MVILWAGTAVAGKADNTLRIAMSGPIVPLDIYTNPSDEAALGGSAVFNTLVAYNTKRSAYVGVIAESWKSIDPLTLEVKIKPGLTFQDGSPLNAEDVAYTVNFLVNPDTKFVRKARFLVFSGAEKVDDLTVRIKLREPYAMLMARLTGMPIFPSDLHSKLGENFADWGRAPVGSGPYKVVQFDQAKGIILERWEGYKLGPIPEVKRVILRSIPDAQSQMAEMMVKGIDLMIADTPEIVTALTANPDIAATDVEDLTYHFAYVDAAGRSELKVFKDKRVRQAVFHAIDRSAIKKKLITGGSAVKDLDRICFPFQVDCPDDAKPLSYDPQKAKALLAEAGYANGFDLQVSTWGLSRPVAEAIVGYLRAVGIRAKVDILTLAAYRKKQADGNLQMLVAYYTHGGLPDAGVGLEYYYSAPSQDYSGDARLFELTTLANREMDGAKRLQLMREAYDRMQNEAFIAPIAKSPSVIVHSKDVVVNSATRGDVQYAQWSFLESYGTTPPILGWAK